MSFLLCLRLFLLLCDAKDTIAVGCLCALLVCCVDRSFDASEWCRMCLLRDRRVLFLSNNDF